MPPRHKARKTAETPFAYPKIDRTIMAAVRKQGAEDPYALSQQAERLMEDLPGDLLQALWQDFGETAIQLPPRERKETNMNVARLIVAFSMQLDTDQANQQ